MKNITLIFFLLLIISSCGKEHTITVIGVNPVTGEPYVGHNVSIRQCRSGTFEDKCKIIYEGTTNENGVDLINIRLKNNRRYRLYLSAPDDYCYQSMPSYNVDKDKDKQEALFEFAPCAYLKLKIENVNCQGPGDKLVLYQGNQIGSFDFDEPWEHNGCVLWESNGYSNVPMGGMYYKWEVTRNNITETFHDTIYLEAGEERIYEINY